MNLFQKNVKELSMANNNFGRCELTELNWIFFLDFLPADYYNQYLVSFDGNCCQNPRRDVHPVVFNICPFILIVNQHTKPGTVCAVRSVVLIWLSH